MEVLATLETRDCENSNAVTFWGDSPSPLPQTLTPRLHQRTEQILDHPPLPRLDLGGHIHSGAQAQAFAVDQNLFLTQGQGCGIVEAFLVVVNFSCSA